MVVKSHQIKLLRLVVHIDVEISFHWFYKTVSFVVLAGFSQLISAIENETEFIENNGMVYIQAGSYTPLFKQDEEADEIQVESFYLDQFQVTNNQFAEFIKKFPKWKPENIKPIFTDKNYLRQFNDQSQKDINNKPVTNISWFAAKAYCKSLGKRLPTVDEWEYVGQASEDKVNGTDDPKYRQQILQWYAKPSFFKLPDVENTIPNYWKVYGMHGVVWELVSDFNTSLVTGESRGDSQLEQDLFCGAGAASSVDPNDYAAFMRYALRSSYEAHYTLSSLGFRCARDANLLANEATNEDY